MKKIFGLLLTVLTLGLAGCERDFDEPLLPEPKYEGEANMTIAQFRDMYNGKAPKEIDADYVMRGIITGNDISGNIYKAIYIEDETGGLSISVDANSMYATHRVGQEVFIDLHGLWATEYGGALQLGYYDGNTNRLPWEMMRDHEHFNGFPQPDKVKPRTLKIADLATLPTDEILHTLVRFDNVYFENGGKNPFSSTTSSTNENIIDASDPTKKLIMRTSQYSSFVSDILPGGTGSVVGILGRFGSDWQLAIRSLDDVFNFPEDPVDPEPGDETVIYYETFGDTKYNENYPVAEFPNYQAEGITYSDASGNTDIRSTTAFDSHVWFRSNTSCNFTASGINTDGYEDLVLSFDVAANMYGIDDPHDLATMFEVSWNGTKLSLPSEIVSNKDQSFHTFTISGGLTSVSSGTLEFSSTSSNTLGLRIDNIKIVSGGGDGGDPGPGPGPGPGVGDDIMLETFGTAGGSIKIGAYSDFSMSALTYSDESGRTDARGTTALGVHAWLPAELADNPSARLKIEGIDPGGKTSLRLSFNTTSNVYEATAQQNINAVKVYANDTEITIPSFILTGGRSADTGGYFDRYYLVDNIVLPDDINTLEFVSDATNLLGVRLDNIRIYSTAE